MQNIISLLLTLLSGLFFLLGFIIVKYSKNKKSLSIFSVSMAFVVMVGIIFLDLVPEIEELINEVDYTATAKILLIIGCSLGGIILLKLLDIFIPHHHHEHHENEKNHLEHQSHLYHIGIVTSSSLILHNIIEGISIYIIGLESFKSGILMAIAVGLHNIPMGIEIASSFASYKKNNNIKTIFMLLLSLSGIFGALLFFILGQSVGSALMVSFMSLSLGMILYIALFELLKEIFNYKRQKEVYYGMIVGILILICISLFE